MWPAPSDDAQKPPSSPKFGRRLSPSPHQQSSQSQPQDSPAVEARRATWRSRLTDMQGASSPMSSPLDSVFGQLSPTAIDRVFPIRSVVSIDPTHTPTARTATTRGDGFPGMTAPSDVNTEPKSGRQSFSIGSSLPQEAAPGALPVIITSNSQRDSDIPESTSEDGLPNSAALDDQYRRPSRNVDELVGGMRQMQPLSDNASIHSQSSRGTKSTGGAATSVTDEAGGLVTARFKHAVTEGGHAVIVGRDGDTLQQCEDEPIHIPGAVQGFGMLVALQEIDDGKLQVRVVSENSKRIIGYSPRELFELNSFCDVLSEEQADTLIDHIDYIRDEDADPAQNGPDVFTLAIRSPKRKALKMWCAMHINEKNRDLIICEFELEDDLDNPLVPTGDKTPEPPEDTLNSDPTPEELAESTVNMSKPLRVLRSARKRKGEAAAMEVFNIMSQVQEQLANTTSLDSFLKVLVGVVKELTGFHRVMIYQFDATWNGKVVTELVDPRATKDLYKGLNFPASDIPQQARDLYKINKVRLLYDRDQETARLVCRTIEDLETPLDLTFAYLRAMSPIHIKYLSHMAVRASMSISINVFDELWGLIACHSYGSKGMRVSFPIRKMCRLVGDSASRNIERLSYASRLQARKLINTVPTANNTNGYIIASSDDLLKLFDADYGLLSIHDKTKILGNIKQMQEALAMLEYLRLRKITSVTRSTDIRIDFPDLRYPPGFSVIAGLLLVPLSVAGSDFIVFFRGGQTREVNWAGNPYEKFIKEGTEGYLEPRKSFRTWSEKVVGKCREWTDEQMETAAVLCLVYGKFIEVWKQKEAALQNSELTKLLLANSAHEVRTPLNAIINYLEIALEGTIDQETRDNLSRSHSASQSLVCVINDLLDLTETEEGHNLIKDEVFDLPETVREATNSFVGDAKRKQIEYEIVEKPGVPRYVIGDQRRVRQAIFNVTANAIQHTSSGAVKVETWLANRVESRVHVDIVVHDTGAGMSPEKLDSLFRDLEQVQTESDGELVSDPKVIEDKADSKRTLGLGLALVARIVGNMDGQLRLKSEEGKGSRFVIQLGFDVPADETQQGVFIKGAEKAGVSPPSNQPSTPPVEEGEVMLVDKSAQKSRVDFERRMGHRRSAESMQSANSKKSFNSGLSARSQVDRLIDAIQEPYTGSKDSFGNPEAGLRASDSPQFQRPGSASSPRRPTSGMLQPQAIGNVLPDNTDLSQEQRENTLGSLVMENPRTPEEPVHMLGKTNASPRAWRNSPQRQSPARTPAGVLYEISAKPAKREDPLNAEGLRVLVAEDDPINSKIIKKRLEKIRHEVHLTINGEECFGVYGEKPSYFDVVLMDMQMPIVDGLTSTKTIRSFEKSHTYNILSKRAFLNGRVPIFAVSASLVERERQTYIDAGFDGWILKPIDFKRLSVLLDGIVQEDTRESCLYSPGQWERGGWFSKRQLDVFAASTAPSTKAPVSTFTPPKSYAQPQEDSTDQERDRLNHVGNDAVHAESTPTDIHQSGKIEESVEPGSASLP